MPFPEVPRVIYRKNPLTEVICQLRFPSILSISSEPPAKFQESLRTRPDRKFPILRVRREINFSLPPPFGEGSPIDCSGLPPTYDFLTKDEKWTISLHQGFIAISTRDYSTWEVFRAELEHALALLDTCYAPDFFSRIGLRYKNEIRPHIYGVDPLNWGTLLAPHILGELEGPDISPDAIEQIYKRVIFSLKDEQGKAMLQHGTTTVDDEKPAYVVDSDFYCDERTEITDAIEKLTNYKRKSARLFRWCITNELHQLMDPIDFDDYVRQRDECA